MTIIIVSGTPGTGKTTFAKKLAAKLKFKYIDVKRVIARCGLSESYDSKRKCKVVDEKKLSQKLVELIMNSKESLVIDSHISHFIPPKYVDLCIITKTDLKELKKRLKKKRYNKAKVRENLDAEIFDVCFEEAKDRGHNVLVVNTTKRSNISFWESKIENAIR